MKPKLILGVVLALFAGACHAKPGTTGAVETPGHPTTNFRLNEDLLASVSDIKEAFRCNIGVYLLNQTPPSEEAFESFRAYTGDPTSMPIETSELRRFTISKTNLSLSLSGFMATNQKGEAGFSVPIGPLAASLGGSAGFGESISTVLTIGLDVIDDPFTVEDIAKTCGVADLSELNPVNYPFVNMLLDFERSVYESAPFTQGKLNKPEFKPTVLNFKSSFSVDKTVGGGVKLSFLFFSIGGSASKKEGYIQTVTVTFNLGDDSSHAFQ